LNACIHFRDHRCKYRNDCEKIHFVEWFWKFWTRLFDEDSKKEKVDEYKKIQKEKIFIQGIKNENEIFVVQISELDQETVGSECERLKKEYSNLENNDYTLTYHKKICYNYEKEGTCKHTWTCNFVHYDIKNDLIIITKK